jgi:FSR family fosmidomycin resistance protein-like MFS transporter
MIRRLGLQRVVLLLAATHFVVDAYANIYAPLLPLLIPKLRLTLADAGVLAMLFQIAASVSQLGFGRLADRWRPRALIVAGPCVAVAVLSLTGLSTSMWMLSVILLVGGLGGAAFHPTAAALVHRAGNLHPGFAMSVHITAGSVGFALGPLVFAPFVGRFGLSWTPVLAAPGVAALAFLLVRVPAVSLRHEHGSGGFRVLRPYAKPLLFLYLIVVLRTLVSLSFATFVPVMLTDRGLSLGRAGALISAYLLAGGLGGLTGGPLADRFGPRRVIAISLVLASPLLAFAPSLSGWAFLGAFVAGGFLLQSTLPVNVTFAHILAPVSPGTVSSLMMGFAWGTGGLMVPFVGMLADRLGVATALTLMAFLPLVAAACAWPLPPWAETRGLAGRRHSMVETGFPGGSPGLDGRDPRA